MQGAGCDSLGCGEMKKAAQTFGLGELYLFVPVSFPSNWMIENKCLSVLLDYSQFIYEAYLYDVVE